MIQERSLNLRDKVDQINEKFSLKAKTNLNTDNLDYKITQLKRKLTTLSQKNNQEILVVKQSASDLLKRAEQTNIQFQNSASVQLKQLQSLTQQLSGYIQSEILQRKQRETQMIDFVEKKVKFLHGQIENERELSQGILAQISTSLQKDVPCLLEILQEGSQSARQDEQRLSQGVRSSISCLTLQWQQFSQKSVLNDKKVSQMVREVGLKARRQVQDQRKLRQQTHDWMLTYVQDTCNKLGSI